MDDFLDLSVDDLDYCVQEVAPTSKPQVNKNILIETRLILSCRVCNNLAHEPTVLPCGIHLFCRSCVMASKKHECPCSKASRPCAPIPRKYNYPILTWASNLIQQHFPDEVVQDIRFDPNWRTRVATNMQKLILAKSYNTGPLYIKALPSFLKTVRAYEDLRFCDCYLVRTPIKSPNKEGWFLSCPRYKQKGVRGIDFCNVATANYVPPVPDMVVQACDDQEAVTVAHCQGDYMNCYLCMNVADKPTILPCGRHIFCYDCIATYWSCQTKGRNCPCSSRTDPCPAVPVDYVCPTLPWASALAAMHYLNEDWLHYVDWRDRCLQVMYIRICIRKYTFYMSYMVTLCDFIYSIDSFSLLTFCECNLIQVPVKYNNSETFYIGCPRFSAKGQRGVDYCGIKPKIFDQFNINKG